MKNEYELEKWIWSETDFEIMGWHDSRIHALAFYPEDFEFALDIDYIFEWVESEEKNGCFKFWVSPATLVFENVYDLLFDIEANTGLEIADINRKDPLKPKNAEHIKREIEYLYEIECQEGTISLKSVGYKMFVKNLPVLQNEQALEIQKRGGKNFHRSKLIT